MCKRTPSVLDLRPHSVTLTPFSGPGELDPTRVGLRMRLSVRITASLIVEVVHRPRGFARRVIRSHCGREAALRRAPRSELATVPGVTDHGIEVAVLGPLQIDGLVHAFRRAASRELVVYLVLHRHGVRSTDWGDALWPARAVPAATLHSVASDARRALGAGAAGTERLPRGGRALRLDESVRSDVERFALLASQPDLAAWIEALSLIRGPFLEGLCLTDWAVLDGTAAQVESMVTTTALQGAAQCLHEGNGSRAEWMVRQALRVSPYDERLYRALLRAADVQGSRARLRSTMVELRSLAAASGDEEMAADQGEHHAVWCHPRTIALYRELARDSAPADGGSFPRL